MVPTVIARPAWDVRDRRGPTPGIMTLRSAVPKLFGTRDQFHGRQLFHGLGKGEGMVQVTMQAMGSDGERQMEIRSLARPPLTSCCAARFLIGTPGIGDPCLR